MVITKYKIHNLINSKAPFPPPPFPPCVPPPLPPPPWQGSQDKAWFFSKSDFIGKIHIHIRSKSIKGICYVPRYKVVASKGKFFFAGEKEQQLTAAVDCLTDHPTSAESVRLHHFAENFSLGEPNNQPNNQPFVYKHVMVAATIWDQLLVFHIFSV